MQCSEGYLSVPFKEIFSLGTRKAHGSPDLYFSVTEIRKYIFILFPLQYEDVDV
jgi:hypothetical protein